MTLADIERIVGLGYRLQDFAVPYQYPAHLLEDNEPWWNESFASHDGKPYRIIIRKQPDGRCVFLDPGKGCTLGEHRPGVCKIFPFWVAPDGRVTFEPGAKVCYMEVLEMPLTDALPRISETEQTIHQHYAQIAGDCQEMAETDKYRQLLVQLLLKLHEPPQSPDHTPLQPWPRSA